ncbi:MAG: ATP-binding protein [Deltaproteobacteria bacterium]|nr:ATP-binding protein [Deltaproteobacteria bacterium]
MIPRLLKPSLKRSFFLFGARGTGKSTLLKSIFKTHDPLWIDLLDPDLEHLYTTNPNRLKEEILEKKNLEWVVVDEVQKVPKLLDIAHDLIENKRLKFALTGSSARKLKAGGANLLAGRANVFNLYPFSVFEIDRAEGIEKTMAWGLLPPLYNEPEPAEKRRILRAYCNTYLKEEVQAEQLVRNMEAFHRFLPVAAQQSGRILNHSSIAREAGIDPKSVQRFYEILEDTLLGFNLPAFDRSIRKQQTKKPKFFLFDVGVKRALEGTLDVPVLRKTGAFGQLFEHFIINEIFKLNSTLELDHKLSYLQTKDGLEIDLIIERPGKPILLVEIKSKEQVHKIDLRHLNATRADFGKWECMVICTAKAPYQLEGARVLPWEKALSEIFTIS